MRLLLKTVITLCITLIWSGLTAQGWKKIDQLPQSEFTALEVIDGLLYAGSGQNLYTSNDRGVTWTHSLITNKEDIWITCFKKFNGKIYAGTSKGIFSANVNAILNIWNHDLQTESVNSFTERNNDLYASLEVEGILKFNGNSWISFTSGLPTYSMSVTKILNTYAGLLAIAGSNGTFYRYDFNQNIWIEDYFNNAGMMPGIHFDDLVFVGPKLYVSRHNTIYRSDDMGENWKEDRLGLISGGPRTMYAANKSLYTITMIGTNMTRLNRRDINASDTNWADDSVVLPFLTYAMREVDGVLFIASGNGIFINDTNLSVPDVIKKTVTLFPNPSRGHFQIQSETPIESIEVYDSLGRSVLSQKSNYDINGFELREPGLYIIQMIAGSTQYTQKIILQN